MIFVNVNYSFEQPDDMDVNLAFFENNMEAYANEEGCKTIKYAERRNWLGNCVGELTDICESINC